MTDANPVVPPVVDPVVPPVVDPVVDPVVPPVDPHEGKTTAEIEAEAKVIEEQNKKAKEGESAEEIRQNQIIRLNKAQGKKDVREGTAPAPETKKDIDTRNLIALNNADIAEGSDKAKILEKYVEGGIVGDYTEAMTNPGVKAEFEAIDAKGDAAAVVDENDTEETQLKTTKEAVASYRKSGKVPEDKTIRTAIVKDNLKEMGF